MAVSDNFPPCQSFTLGEEGGFSNDPRDPGGATNLGITLSTLSHWRKAQCAPSDVRALTPDLVAPIYKVLYWNAMRCWDLPPGIDLMVFDFGCNAGQGTSALLLQTAVGVDRDEEIGPVTAGAARGADVGALIASLFAAQQAYYRSLAGFPTFGNGWLARTGRRRALALSMGGLLAATVTG